MARWLVVFAVACGNASEPPKAAPPVASPKPVTDRVTISGTVIDRATGDGVDDIVVSLRGANGRAERETASDGSFTFTVAPGSYRVLATDKNNRLIMVGVQNRVRLDNGPRPELAVADEGLLPTLDATRDIRDLEIVLTPAAVLTGHIWDPEDALDDAVVRLRPVDRSPFDPRPVLGTDSAVVSNDGSYTLRVPPGHYLLEVYHPKYAGGEALTVSLAPGKQVELDTTLVRGCIITGKVVQADGTPAHDGAMERMDGERFGPSGKIDTGGTFRWATTVAGEVTLRAWPWHSPPSEPKTFRCKDGKRYDNVVMRLPDSRPDLSGTIVDAHGAPVAFAFVDLIPLDPTPPALSASQQERADASGSWHIYDVPAGRYKLLATAPGRGVVDSNIVAPKQDIKLQLSGTGRIAGTTTELVTGTFEVSFLHCGGKADALAVAHESRIVVVRGGRFTIENAPACMLAFAVRWRDQIREAQVIVEPDRTAYLELELGAPRDKSVSGVVRDPAGKPIANARVTALIDERETETVRCDKAGHYTLKTRSGAQLVAGDGDHVGRASVGRANVTSEQLDIVLDDKDQ